MVTFFLTENYFFRFYLTKEELFALTYNDIDLEKRTISVNKFYQRIEGRDIITPPKTPKSKHIITIPPFWAEELREYVSHLISDGYSSCSFLKIILSEMWRFLRISLLFVPPTWWRNED